MANLTALSRHIKTYITSRTKVPEAINLCMAHFADHLKEKLEKKDRYIALLEERCKNQRDKIAKLSKISKFHDELLSTQINTKKQVKELQSSLEKEKTCNRRCLAELRATYEDKFRVLKDINDLHEKKLTRDYKAEIDEARTL